jgi:hypothetical protein
VTIFLVAFGVLILAGRFSTRRDYSGKRDSATGRRFQFSVASDWSLAAPSPPGFSTKLDDFVFSMPKPDWFETLMDRYVLHITPYQYRHAFLKNELHVCSGDRERSGGRSPFRNFVLENGYPTPKHPDFVDPAGTVVEEETHLLVAGQPALWRGGRVDVPVGTKGRYPVYEYMLVVKVKDRDLWFAISGIEGEDYRHRIRDEIRSIGDSLRIEER